MNGRKRGFSPPAVGGSALLVIFAVLCLTVFAALALATVGADSRLSQKNADAAAAYYAADTQAETILARLRAGTVPEGVAVSGHVYSYACPVSDVLSLEVEVRVAGGSYTVLRWQTVSTEDWQPDESLHVWNGE